MDNGQWKDLLEHASGYTAKYLGHFNYVYLNKSALKIISNGIKSFTFFPFYYVETIEKKMRTFYDFRYSMEGIHSQIAPSAHPFVPCWDSNKIFEFSISNFDDGGEQLLSNCHQTLRFLVVLLRVYFNNRERKKPYGNLRGVGNLTFVVGNGENIKRTEDLKTILPTAQFFPPITLNPTHQNTWLYSSAMILREKILTIR